MNYLCSRMCLCKPLESLTAAQISCSTFHKTLDTSPKFLDSVNADAFLSGCPTKQTVNNSDGAVMDDVSLRHPDPLVNGGLQSFPVQRHLLETRMNGPSEAKLMPVRLMGLAVRRRSLASVLAAVCSSRAAGPDRYLWTRMFLKH